MQRFENAREAALALRPDAPVYCFRPEVLKTDARAFMEMFPGRTAYAVKTNGELIVLKALVEAGVTMFDVASPGEFAAVREVSTEAEMIYMHPVKAQSDIRLALETYGIRVIAVDHEDEIMKLNRVVRALDIDPGAITVFVRVQTKGSAAYELSKKFGAGPANAVELCERLNRNGYKVGLCFHVGSQIEDPDTYERALASVDWVRNRVSFDLAGLDVGGGFPAEYGHDPNSKKPAMPSIGQIMSRLRGDLNEYNFDEMPLVAEPGRVIVARCLSLIVRVLLRKGRRLYINDGIWASLSDSWTGKITLPARFIPDPAIRARNGDADKIVPFKVCGATCDSVDILSRPFWLPETIDTGDWIEIGHIGAYSLSLRTRFNGFYPDTFVEVTTPFDEGDAPQGFASLETMAAE
ncbi:MULTISPECIES: alanine racemase [Aminobacter]|uniref:Ornithine decarboxylase n=1 Tax=Aminobacter ciceronei TaxID=150723 RepID=A0ABR6CG72_9HYPH|nr:MULTISPECIES: alanine racemase [Aminobacter]MBA8909595.1 ornithine decarboxylase [Aminobacter ciceronei]MBA9023367.1 ornithine decarboxylase [Aminobacter ciceronei]MRX36140.1 ornithine decarboxylase [Aminobacter sp. MDW-2]QNH31825.1 alanine racemase [Aminobacter sp. MDW-2]